jgi:acetoin utilization protein AcuB
MLIRDIMRPGPITVDDSAGPAVWTDVGTASAMGIADQSTSPSARARAIVADVMTPFPLTVSPDTPVVDAVALMVDHHVRHLPVVDTKSDVVGMLSERDVRTAIGDPAQYIELSRATVRLRVRDVMSVPVTCVPFDRPLLAVAQELADMRIGAVPVLDKFGALVGILSYVDALRELA